MIYGLSHLLDAGHKKQSNALEGAVKWCLFTTCPMTDQWHSYLSRWTENVNHRTTLWQIIYMPQNCNILSVCLASVSQLVNLSGFMLVTLTTCSLLFLKLSFDSALQCAGWYRGWSCWGQGEEMCCTYISHTPSGLLMFKMSLKWESCKHPCMGWGAIAPNQRKANGCEQFHRKQ